MHRRKALAFANRRYASIRTIATALKQKPAVQSERVDHPPPKQWVAPHSPAAGFESCEASSSTSQWTSLAAAHTPSTSKLNKWARTSTSVSGTPHTSSSPLSPPSDLSSFPPISSSASSGHTFRDWVHERKVPPRQATSSHSQPHSPRFSENCQPISAPEFTGNRPRKWSSAGVPRLGLSERHTDTSPTQRGADITRGPRSGANGVPGETWLNRDLAHRHRTHTHQYPESDWKHTVPYGSTSTTRIAGNAPSFTGVGLSPDLVKVKESNTLDHLEGAVNILPHTRGSRHVRDSYKERGSIVSRIQQDVAMQTQSRGGHRPQKADPVKSTKTKAIPQRKVVMDVYIPSTVSVGMLANLLNVRLEQLQRKMIKAGMESDISYDHVLTADYAVLLAEEFGRNPIVNDEAAFDIYPSPPHVNAVALPARPPVVTIMGHVDHGKTTLLDTLRSSSVAKGEAGGITQHIGAFSVPVSPGSGSSDGPRTITFLDTPGHAAFSAMRARGAGVTDIVVLVVAADDGIMPQTREVIELVKKDEGKVGLVVAINKVDKPGVNVDNVQKALLAENIQLEVFGGDIPSVEVSGLTGLGLPELVETLSAMAEMQDLRAECDGMVHGYVLESKVLKGLGPVATVLILRGCLKPGSHIISGTAHAKVRAMNDPSGATVKAAYPGMATIVSGWKTLPNAGDQVLQGSEQDVKKAVANRIRKAEIEATLLDMEAINSRRRLEREQKGVDISTELQKEPNIASTQGPKELRLVIKGDVSGSVEAVVGALQGIGNKEAIVKIVSTGVGDVSESDVMMAKAAGGMVVAFSVCTPRSVEVKAAQNGVPLYSSAIIYRLMDDIRARIIALLPVIIEKRVTGEATVLQLFDIQIKAKQTMKVAGCRVTNGLVEKSKKARVLRDGTTIHEGPLDTLRQMKKDMTEVRKGSECGLHFDGFDDIQEGDLIQMVQEIEKPGIL